MTTKIPKRIPHIKLLVRGKPLSVDKLVYIALISPVMALPQLYLILTGDAAGVSVVTWATFLTVAVVWLAYGVKHRIKPIIVLQSVWIIVDAAIVAGILLQS